MIWVPPHSTGNESSEGEQPDSNEQLSLRSTEAVSHFRERSLLVLTECQRVYEEHNRFRHLVDAILQGRDDYSEVIEELTRETGGISMLIELEKLVAGNERDFENSPMLADLSELFADPGMRIRFVSRAGQVIELAHELTSTMKSIATIMRCIAYKHPRAEHASTYGTVDIAGKGTMMMFEKGLHMHPKGNIPTVELPAIMRRMEQIYRQLLGQLKI